MKVSHFSKKLQKILEVSQSTERKKFLKKDKRVSISYMALPNRPYKKIDQIIQTTNTQEQIDSKQQMKIETLSKIKKMKQQITSPIEAYQQRLNKRNNIQGKNIQNLLIQVYRISIKIISKKNLILPSLIELISKIYKQKSKQIKMKIIFSWILGIIQSLFNLYYMLIKKKIKQ